MDSKMINLTINGKAVSVPADSTILDAAKKLRDGEIETSGRELPIEVFLHFPPVFREFRCEEILAVLREFGVTRCFYGHIHGVYDMPGSFVDDGIKFTMVSADYLGFTPLHIPKVP